MFKRNRLFSSMLVAILLISFSGCNSKPNENDGNSSIVVESVASEDSSMVEREEATTTEQENALETDTVGNIRFSL